MGLLPFVQSTYGKALYAMVTTMDADLDRIAIEPDWTGRQLFDTVCRIIGLREIWFFGLQFSNKKQIPCWLQMDKKVLKQDVAKSDDGTLHFLFLVKFYPEEVEEELIQDLTRHLFFVQIKEAILSMELFASAEASVLLASFAVQAMYGDYNETVELELEKLLPENVRKQYDMSDEMWADRIRRWWANNHGQSREDAKMEYLRVAQDLDMYGIQYYPIFNKKEADLHLGVSAQGIGIYKGMNRITPRPFFSWNEIKSIRFKNKKFSMKTMDKSEIAFRAQDASINMSILDVCIGTHNLYLRRRQPDLLEVQQMRANAIEQRIRRQQEHSRLVAEREERMAVEAERNNLKKQVELLSEKLKSTEEAMRKTEETAELLAEKARASENSALALSKRISEAEAECQRVKISHHKAEEGRARMERKAREMEILAGHSLGDSAGRPLFASHSALIADPAVTTGSLNGWSQHQVRPSMSFHELMLSSSSQEDPVILPGSGPPTGINNNILPAVNIYRQPLPAVNGIPMGDAPQLQPQQAPPPPDPRGELLLPPDFRGLCADLEKSRKEYNERTRSFKDKLAEFRSEIEGLKREDRVPTENESAHACNVANGFDKFSTIRMSQREPPKSRVKQLDAM